MRKVSLSVGSNRVGEALTWAYPAGRDLGLYKTPVYMMTLSGVDSAAVTQTVNVLRFGVHC